MIAEKPKPIPLSQPATAAEAAEVLDQVRILLGQANHQVLRRILYELDALRAKDTLGRLQAKGR